MPRFEGEVPGARTKDATFKHNRPLRLPNSYIDMHGNRERPTALDQLKCLRNCSRFDMGFRNNFQATARILVIEDEALLRMLIADELRSAGHEVIEAGSADEAEQIINHEESIDLVFTDVQTPGRLDGLTLARAIHDCRPELPVIITSGNYGPGDAAGLGLFVPKPYDVAVVCNLVDEVLVR